MYGPYLQFSKLSIKQYDYIHISLKINAFLRFFNQIVLFFLDVLKMPGRKQGGNFDVYRKPSALNSDKKQCKINVRKGKNDFKFFVRKMKSAFN